MEWDKQARDLFMEAASCGGATKPSSLLRNAGTFSTFLSSPALFAQRQGNKTGQLCCQRNSWQHTKRHKEGREMPKGRGAAGHWTGCLGWGMGNPGATLNSSKNWEYSIPLHCLPEKMTPKDCPSCPWFLCRHHPKWGLHLWLCLLYPGVFRTSNILWHKVPHLAASKAGFHSACALDMGVWEVAHQTLFTLSSPLIIWNSQVCSKDID